MVIPVSVIRVETERQVHRGISDAITKTQVIFIRAPFLRPLQTRSQWPTHHARDLLDMFTSETSIKSTPVSRAFTLSQ